MAVFRAILAAVITLTAVVVAIPTTVSAAEITVVELGERVDEGSTGAEFEPDYLDGGVFVAFGAADGISLGFVEDTTYEE